jgi:hypothetical protein
LSKSKRKSLHDLAGSFLLSFPILDNSVASLFSAVFGARSNSVEIFYGNIALQARLDCIRAFCSQHTFPFEDPLKEEIESIIEGAGKVQAFRNLLAHNFILSTDIVVRGRIAEELSKNRDPNRFFVWKTTKKGKYEVKPISSREVEAALSSIGELSVRISTVCATIRWKHGLRP